MSKPGSVTPPAPPGEGRLAANIMHFGRVLRAAGLPIGPGKVLDAIGAVRAVGIGSRVDFYWTLHAVLVNRRDQRELFDQAFHVFWRNPRLLERMMNLLLPTVAVPGENDRQLSRRLTEALHAGREPGGGALGEDKKTEIEIDAVMTFSDREVLREKDFEQMSADEIRRAKTAIKSMRLALMEVPTRRYRSWAMGERIDMRATLRAALRSGGHDIPLIRRTRRRRHPPLVILCDISGSMTRYSRMLLHFMHAVTNDRDRVYTFLFGTRLTNVTRYLRYRDVDLALEKISGAVADWSGGTRIGSCMAEFNLRWSRRVLGQGAVVLFISDGLDREGGEILAREMERLHKSCRRLIWLNPLLRYDGFQPKSMGVKAILPHVDDFRAAHNLKSLEDLTGALGRTGRRREEEGVRKWLAMVE